jgi:VWFA-related protein
LPLLFPARPKRHCTVFSVALLLCASGVFTRCISAQDTPPATLTVNARLVVLDVVVTGKDGKPVEGLGEKDFQVFEDGKLQRIRSVERPAAHALPAATVAEGAAATFNPAEPASFGRSPVNVLVLDQLNTHFADSSFARRELHDYLEKQPALLPQPTTLLTVYENRFKQLQGFTRDRDKLLHALAAAPTEYAWRLEVSGKADYGPIERLDQSLRALEQIAQSYSAIPGRKNLVWVGGGFPTLDPTELDGDDLKEVQDTLQHITDVLLDTRVTVYAVDPTSSAAGMTEITDPSQVGFMQSGAELPAGAADPFNSSEDFDKLGPVTGGRVVRGMNNIAQQIATAVDLGSSFYTVSYSPTSTSDAEAKYRKIQVVCLRAGLTATTRAGYYSGQSQKEKSAATASYDLTSAAESNVPLNGLRVSVVPGSSPDSYVVKVGAGELTWKQKSDGSSAASVYVMAVSLNAKSKMLGHTLHGMAATARPGVDLRAADRQADFDFTAPPSPKATSLRFIVRDSATGRMGSADLPLSKH